MASIVDIADAVVDALNGATFSQPFTAVRSYRPAYDLSEMSTLRVTVVPRGIESAGGSRSASQHDCSVDVAVQQKLQTTDDAKIDALMGLVEEVADFFQANALPGLSGVSWLRTENKPVFLPEHLEEMRQFTSVLTLTYRTWR